MKIVCPECSFTREVDEAKIPPRTKVATCPKCNHRFQFREISDTASQESFSLSPSQSKKPSSTSVDSSPTIPPSSEEIWDSLSAMRSPDNQMQDLDTDNNRMHPSPEGENTENDGSIPWEHLDQYGFFPGFIETIKKVMRHPVIFFRDMTFGSGIGKPLVFYLLIAEIQALAQFFWQVVGLAPMMTETPGGTAFGLGMMGMSSALILVMYPLILTLMLFVMVGVNHLCLLLFKAADRGFTGTFRAVTYGSAPMVLALLPFVGPVVGALWTMVTTFFGYKYIHKTSTARVTMAMLLPILIMTLAVLTLFLAGGIPPDQFR